MYMRGKYGVPVDKKKGAELLTKAAEQGDAAAQGEPRHYVRSWVQCVKGREEGCGVAGEGSRAGQRS
jgi:TPR repeat protein